MEESLDMEKILSQEKNGLDTQTKAGKINDLQIVAFTSDSVLVDVGGKSEGIISKDEISDEKLNDLKIGDSIPVFVYNTGLGSGAPKLSYRKALFIRAWDKIIDKKNNNQAVTGKVKKHVKGGLVVEVEGIEAFMPASQLDIRPVEDYKNCVGKSFDFYVIETRREKSDIIVSRRKLLEDERNKKRDDLFRKLNIGDTVTGKVAGITRFGAFIEIEGVDALLHEKEFSWDSNDRIKDNLRAGQEIELKVTGLDPKDGRISLSRKQMMPHPWDGIEERHPQGSEIEGVITSITNFGAFVRVDKGVEGLIHISEFSWKEKNPNIKKKYKPGDLIKARVISIDRKKEKLSLSIKRAEANPWEEAKSLYHPGMRMKGRVTHLAPFGAFVELPIGVEGLIQTADMDWIKKIKHPREMLSVGTEVEFVVLNVEPTEEKISLSLRDLKQNPFKRYKPGVIVEAVVEKIMNFGVFVSLENNVRAFMHVSEIYFEDKDPKKKLKHPKEVLHEKQRIKAKVIKTDQQERTIDISMKKYERDIEKEEMKKYMGKKSSPTLGEIFSSEPDEDNQV